VVEVEAVILVQLKMEDRVAELELLILQALLELQGKAIQVVGLSILHHTIVEVAEVLEEQVHLQHQVEMVAQVDWEQLRLLQELLLHMLEVEVVDVIPPQQLV
jgi:hypothetical protein